jgi:adenylate kinase
VPLNVVMLGPPGAGKGTQAERFAREHGIPTVSTGDILREAVHSGSVLGRAVKEVMARGELVGDDLMLGIVRERLARPDAANGFVLDGFPRTVAQAKALDDVVADRGPVLVVEIQVPDEALVARVKARRVCDDCGATADAFAPGSGVLPEKCLHVNRCRSVGPKWSTRSDDSEAVVRERLRVYHRQTAPVIAHYSGQPTYRAIDGRQSPEQVRQQLIEALASALGCRPNELVTAGRGRA